MTYILIVFLMTGEGVTITPRAADTAEQCETWRKEIGALPTGVAVCVPKGRTLRIVPTVSAPGIES